MKKSKKIVDNVFEKIQFYDIMTLLFCEIIVR